MQFEKVRGALSGPAFGGRSVALRTPFAAFVAAALFCFFAAVLLYRNFPEFLLQHHDGMHAYALLQTLRNWSQFAVGSTVTPIEGMATFSYPLNLYLTPHLWPFFFFRDPNSQIFWIYVSYAEILFASCYFVFRAMSVAVPVSIATALLTVLFWTTQQDPHIAGLQGGILYFVAIILGCFARCGRGDRLANALFAAAFVCAVLAMLCADISTSMLGGPTLGLVGAVLLLSARGPEVFWKIAAIIGALAVLVVAGFPEYAILLFRGTARIYYGNAISLQSRSFHVAGIPYHPSDLSRGLYVLSLLSSVAVLFASRTIVIPRTLFILATTSLALLIAWAVIGVLYVTENLPWIGPAPWYYQWAYYPFLVLLPVHAIYLASQAVAPRAAFRVVLAGAAAGTVIFALLSAADHRTSYEVGLCLVAFLVLGVGLAKQTRGIVILVLVCGAVFVSVQTPFVWADKRRDMRERLSLNPLPIVEFVAARVAIAPGQPFRGYIDDFYTGGDPTTKMLDEILKHWHKNVRLYGSGFHTFNWQAFSIPTLSQYNTFMTPDYFWFYSRLQNTHAQQQSVSMIALTHPDLTMLAAMGARYLVVNDANPELDGKSREVYSWKELRVRELSDPNLMSYSPVDVSVLPSWAEALTAVAQPAFDPRRQVVLDRKPAQVGPFLPATTSRARFERGGFHLSVEAAGPAMVLLPMQYSHCYEITSGRGQLVRANIAMMALVVDGSTEISAAFKFGPFGHTACRRRDLQEIEANLPKTLDPVSSIHAL